MGLLSALLQRFRPLVIDDEFFGRMVYMRMPKGRVSYWEAQRPFAPIGREIELFIDAPSPEQPPDETQRQFFMDLESGYGEIADAIDPALRLVFEEWTRKPLEASFTEEFTLTSFAIPRAPLVSPWEMSFDSKSDSNHLFTVTLRGRDVIDVAVDG